MENAAHRIWRDACRAMCGASPEDTTIWYSDIPTLDAEILLCQSDAAKGDERAIRYMTKFIELRMKS